MGIEDLEVPEVPIPIRIIAEKRAKVRRENRSLSRKQKGRKVRSTPHKSANKAS